MERTIARRCENTAGSPACRTPGQGLESRPIAPFMEGQAIVKRPVRFPGAGAVALAAALAAGVAQGAAAAPKPTAASGAPEAEWRTPAEISGYRKTPRYDETMAYVRRIAAAAPGKIRLETFGVTGEGRELVAVVASGDGVFDPAKLHRANRPVVLIQNAIHAGEMDGKDSC